MGKISVGVDRDLVVKRYMSLGKFESLINSGSLYFSRFDRFTDKLEGGINSQNYPDISVSAELFDLTINYRASDPASPEKTQTEKRINEINNETFEGIFGSEKKLDGDSYLQLVSSWLYANCWTDLDHECDAMWSLYGITGVGCNHVECCPQCESTHGMSVCIETTIGAILDNLELDERYNLSIQKVDYIDHKKIKFEAHELSTKPFFSKARHFSYENEVRLMLWPDRSDISFSYVYQQSTVNDKKSVELKIKNISSFINKIILSPIPAKKSAQLRTSHYEAHQSTLGLKDSLANYILREKVQTLCSANSLSVEILDSGLNQVATSDCYTFMDDFK